MSQQVEGEGNVLGGRDVPGPGAAVASGSSQAAGAAERSAAATGQASAAVRFPAETKRKRHIAAAFFFFALVVVAIIVLVATDLKGVAIPTFIVGGGGLGVQVYRLATGL